MHVVEQLDLVLRTPSRQAKRRQIEVVPELLAEIRVGVRDAELIARPGREPKVMLVVVPRLFAQLLKEHAPAAGSSLFPFPDRVWDGASVQLPPEIPSQLTNLFTGEKHSAAAGALTAAELFREFPVAVLVSE